MAAVMSSPSSPYTKSLQTVLSGVQSAEVPDLQISDITLDSRAAQPGAMFLALRGIKSHGLDFAAQAIANGANVVVYEPGAGITPPQKVTNVEFIAVPELHRQVGAIADQFFDRPSAAMDVVGVTGTNGKTTSAFL